ncbi:MAG TPA: hypothetical protein VNM92_01680 [Thermoanaerobaculia bacterium]|nr:hypothetical protein [Thermoanaerobaculia bacterium]
MRRVEHGVPASVTRLETPALIAGVIGLVLCAIGAFVDSTQFFRSYLVAYIFVIGIALGSLGVLMIQFLTGGTWGVLIRRSLESATRTLPLLAIAFIPLALGMQRLYIWTDHNLVAHDHVLHAKAPYLNVTFFLVRTAFYFAVWILFSTLLNRWSKRYEETSMPELGLRLRHVSAAGLLVMAITLTFASIDWMMSLEPHWYSTMYGISFIIGNCLSALAFSSAMVVLMSREEPISAVARPVHFRDLGNLIFAFVMLWAYTAFSQFMLIWYANIREEVPWYTRRMSGGWGTIAALLIVFHFFLPFFVLLIRAIKDNPRYLGLVALFVLLMRAVDVFWLIAPGFHPEQAVAPFSVHWMDPAAIVGLGGLWLFFFLRFLRQHPVLPFNEEYVQEALSHG